MTKAIKALTTIRAGMLAGAAILSGFAAASPARAQSYARVGAEYLLNRSGQVVAVQPVSVQFYTTSALCNTAFTNLQNAGMSWGNAVNTAQSLTGTYALQGSAAGGCINNGTTSFTATTTTLHINQTYFGTAFTGAPANVEVDVPTDATSGSGAARTRVRYSRTFRRLCFRPALRALRSKSPAVKAESEFVFPKSWSADDAERRWQSSSSMRRATMFKAVCARARSFGLLLACFLFAGAPAAKASTFVGFGIPVMTSYGFETVLYNSMYGNQVIAPFTITNMLNLSACNTSLTNYRTAVQAAGVAANGSDPNVTYTALGGCLGIGPASGSSAYSWMMVQYYDGNYGGFTVIVPMANLTECSANKATVAGWVSSLPLASQLAVITCL